MTKEEILQKLVYSNGLLHEDILKAMDEYGRQCFEASRESEIKIITGFDMDWKIPVKMYDYYEDYLKEQENEKN